MSRKYERLRILVFAGLSISAAVFLRLPVRARSQSGVKHTVLQLRIWSDKKVYLLQEGIPIHVELSNISDHDVFVGKDLWMNASPSRVTLSVTPLDGHAMRGIEFAVDGLAPGAFDDFPRAVLRWCFLLPPGYSYSSTTQIGGHVEPEDLTPGSYKVRVVYESLGIDSNTYFNPLLGHPEELERLRPESWKGVIGSNEIVIRIAAAPVRAGRRPATR